MSARRRHTTRAEDLAFLRQRVADAARPWAVGDRCLSYNLQEETTVARIEPAVHASGPNDLIAHLANGDHMHVSKLRGVRS